MALDASDSVSAWLSASQQERIAVAELVARELNPNVTIRRAAVRAYINCIGDLAKRVDSKFSVYEVAKACPRVVD